jgi:ketopantoate hydroxymethyltransferase
MKIQKERIKAFKKYDLEVKKGIFPSKKHSISIDKKELISFKKSLRVKKDN